MNKIPLGNSNDCWILRSDSSIYHNSSKIFEIEHKVEESDVLVSTHSPLTREITNSYFLNTKGVTYDHEVLNFYLNGNDLDAPVTGIRGTVFPVFYVDDGAILDVQFNTFYHQPPIGYGEILLEKTIL